ncbi:MAG: CehA/McbA family metallohydrolase [Clostridia bacterium]
MKKKLIAGILSLIMAVTPFVSLPAISYADSGTCGVKQGATEILEGMATDKEDITIWNDKMAVSFAVGSNNYWNMTKGSILDICAIDSNGWGPDLVNDVELLMDLWTATGAYEGTDLRNDVKVTPSLSKDKKTVTVTSEYQYWVADPNKDGVNEKNALPLNVTQVYTLKAGDSHLSMETTVENPNKDIDYGNSSTGMFSGYSISTNAANMFGPYGYYPDTKATGIAIGKNKNVNEYFGKFVTTYKDNYAVSLIMDNSDSYKGSSGYKDLYTNQVLEAGKFYTFKGEVLVETSNSTASVLDRIYERDKINDDDTAMVSGTVTDEGGNPVEDVNVIVKKDGKYMCTDKSGSVNGAGINTLQTINQPMVWAITDKDGRYSFKLPKTTNNFDKEGTYEYTLKLEKAGYSSLTSEEFTLKDDRTQNFTIESGAPVRLSAKDQNGKAIPFRVEISGVTYENKCAGISTYFSNSADKEKNIEFNLTQAKDVTFTASYGKNFESKAVPYKTNVTAKGVEYEFKIDEIVDPKESGWVSMDNHQHSNYGDGATTPKDLFNAQIAAKLHYNLVADHDTRINNIEMKAFSDKIGRPYISNMEVSPGWGHWGVLNVDFSKEETGNIVNASTATPPEIIKAGHKANALVIVHHPYSDYGFLHNQDSVAGGHADGWKDFDLLELQSTISSDGKTLDKLEELTAENYENISLDKLSSTIASAGISQMDAKALVTAFAFWNAGEKKYLSAGSDQHQATNTALYPGIIRQYAKVGKGSKEATNADSKAYLEALKDGRSYVTMGPFIMTENRSVTLFPQVKKR